MLLRSKQNLSSASLLISPPTPQFKEDDYSNVIHTNKPYYLPRVSDQTTTKFSHKPHSHSPCPLQLPDAIHARSSARVDSALQQQQQQQQQEETTYLLMILNFTRCIRSGCMVILRVIAILSYAFLISPGFLRGAYYYYTSSHVRRDIVYGDQPRNKLDLYLPIKSHCPKPVVVFITGGAWILGYKAWGCLLGKQLCERDIIVACIDYRNFPQVSMSKMVQDASEGISFVCKHIADYGGDPNRIYLMGQSAGAHIASCAIVDQAIKEAGDCSLSWSVKQIKIFFGLSGGYNLFELLDHFHNRGLSRSVFLRMMEGEESLGRFSPEVKVEDPANRKAVSLLPRTILFHGTQDYSIPCHSSKSFAKTLERVGVEAEAVMYEGKTHTDVFVQDPMRGGDDEMVRDLVAVIHAADEEALDKDDKAPPSKRLAPEFMLKLARIVSPF
ncbi:isoprenylcysteine alpha-carbonyl methylesterase ICME-like [Impatiens glandulifera]|uniref:isoprenylcysteine alpha-carbonyl methylesterase ICME-like n=1 Tax=Impatiens glandulifera TaxID=253017 RepID=UPI001FB14CD7|nr:isoprenylcysteine alpha-carbonyl methylesterase ICME-like [Impatiens glandulifera]